MGRYACAFTQGDVVMPYNKAKDDLKRQPPSNPNQELWFTLPIPPSVNHMYIATQKSKGLTSDAKRFIVQARKIVTKETERQNWLCELKHVWFYMDLFFYFPDKRIRDSHNTIKILMDAVQGIPFENDYYVMPRVQHVTLDKANPRVVVHLFAQETERRIL